MLVEEGGASKVSKSLSAPTLEVKRHQVLSNTPLRLLGDLLAGRLSELFERDSGHLWRLSGQPQRHSEPLGR